MEGSTLVLLLEFVPLHCQRMVLWSSSCVINMINSTEYLWMNLTLYYLKQCHLSISFLYFFIYYYFFFLVKSKEYKFLLHLFLVLLKDRYLVIKNATESYVGREIISINNIEHLIGTCRLYYYHILFSFFF